MRWNDEALLLEVTNLGEDKLILSCFTRYLGRESGVVKREALPFLPGACYWVDSMSRNPGALGTLKLELIQNYPVRFQESPRHLVLQSAIDMLCFLIAPKDPHPELFDATRRLFECNSPWPNILVNYCHWELILLKELGFGLSLESCAVTQETSNLRYVAPNSARAISRNAGQAYKNQLLRLPPFLLDEQALFEPQELKEGLQLTGYFLRNKLFPQLGSQSPESRNLLESSLL